MKSVFPVVVILFLSACEGSKTSEADVTSNGHNILTEAQMAGGWNLLFNGSDLGGWHFYKDRDCDSWEVVDGTLHCKPFDDAGQRADLVSNHTYDDFELAFEWKVGPQGNSGVMFRVTEQEEQPYFSGPEYQLIDDDGYPGDPLPPTQRTGANYDMHAPPAATKPNPVGEWNVSRIVVRGALVEHWLNGVRLFDYELYSPDWVERKNNSKWNDVEPYGMTSRGHIVLQDHSMEVWFRNVFIKPL